MAPQAQPIVSVDEIDEALWWVVLTAPRDRHYERIIDALPDQRNRISSGRRGQDVHQPERPQSREDHRAWDSTEAHRCT